MTETLAVFTPSLVSPSVLEKLFVGRDAILADIVKRAEEALSTSTRAHRMIIGPRGAGKTHLMSLAHHRISAITPSPLIAWLAEDPWTVNGYDDLLRAILLAATRDTAHHIAPVTVRRASAEELEQRLRALAETDGTITVLSENFDQILTSIDIDGQRRLRGFMENFRSLLLLVTATRLTESTVEQNQPFYGFFSTVDLQPFSVEQATDMLCRLAKHRGQNDLAKRLANPSLTDKYRLQAIDALAGGQPRVWAIFGSALTIDSLDDLPNFLLAKFDDLTPYYQEQLSRLSAQERNAIRTLADLDHAVNVRDLGVELGLNQKSVAKTVTTLKRSGWIVEVASPINGGDRRKTYYELAEPLARLAFQLKDSRGKPIPLLVTFLSLWFSREELTDGLQVEQAISRPYLLAALAADGASTNGLTVGLAGSSQSRPAIAEAMLLELADALEAAHSGHADQFFALPTTVRRLAEYSICDLGLESTWRATIALSSRTASWLPRAEALLRSGTELLLNRSEMCSVLQVCGRFTESLALLTQNFRDLVQIHGPDHPDTLSNRANIAALTASLGNAAQAFDLFVQLHSDLVRVLGDDHPDTLAIRANVAFYTGITGSAEKAIDLFQKLLSDQMRVLGKDHSDSLGTRNNIAFWTGFSGDTRQALSLFEELLIDQERILGSDHLDTLTTRNNFANLTGRVGNHKQALLWSEELLFDQMRVLGADHRDTLTTRNNLAVLIARVGDKQQALSLFEELLFDQERLLGVNHSDTVTTRHNIAGLTTREG